MMIKILAVVGILCSFTSCDVKKGEARYYDYQENYSIKIPDTWGQADRGTGPRETVFLNGSLSIRINVVDKNPSLNLTF